VVQVLGGRFGQHCRRQPLRQPDVPGLETLNNQKDKVETNYPNPISLVLYF
jgi:hypothetical protein